MDFVLQHCNTLVNHASTSQGYRISIRTFWVRWIWKSMGYFEKWKWPWFFGILFFHTLKTKFSGMDLKFHKTFWISKVYSLTDLGLLYRNFGFWAHLAVRMAKLRHVFFQNLGFWHFFGGGHFLVVAPFFLLTLGPLFGPSKGPPQPLPEPFWGQLGPLSGPIWPSRGSLELCSHPKGPIWHPLGEAKVAEV